MRAETVIDENSNFFFKAVLMCLVFAVYLAQNFALLKLTAIHSSIYCLSFIKCLMQTKNIW